MDAQPVALDCSSMNNAPSVPKSVQFPPRALHLEIETTTRMKTILLLVCATLLLATGCSRHYNVTLNNGATVTALTKPKLTPNGTYVFKDGAGKMTEVNSMRVKLIEPTSIAKQHSTKYNQPFQYR